MALTYSEIDASISDAVRQIASASAQLEALQQGARGIVDTLNRIVQQKSAMASELDARVHPQTGDKRGDPAWEALKARKDAVVVDLQRALATATDMLNALDAVASK